MVDLLAAAEYNFAFTPVVHALDAWRDMKAHGYVRPEAGFLPIHMPRNTGAGVILAGLGTAAGFGFIWQMWWLAAGGLVAVVAVAIGHSFNDEPGLPHPRRGRGPHRGDPH